MAKKEREIEREKERERRRERVGEGCRQASRQAGSEAGVQTWFLDVFTYPRTCIAWQKSPVRTWYDDDRGSPCPAGGQAVFPRRPPAVTGVWWVLVPPCPAQVRRTLASYGRRTTARGHPALPSVSEWQFDCLIPVVPSVSLVGCSPLSLPDYDPLVTVDQQTRVHACNRGQHREDPEEANRNSCTSLTLRVAAFTSSATLNTKH